MAAGFTMASFVLDYGDGMAARSMNLQSELGKQLDSLADVVSFGVARGLWPCRRCSASSGRILYGKLLLSLESCDALNQVLLEVPDF